MPSRRPVRRDSSASASAAAATPVRYEYYLPPSPELAGEEEIAMRMVRFLYTFLQDKARVEDRKHYRLTEDKTRLLDERKKPTRVMLAYDSTKKCFFTEYDPKPFEAWLQKLTPVSITDLENVFNLKTLTFLTPYFAWQWAHPNEFSKQPREWKCKNRVALPAIGSEDSLENVMGNLIHDNKGIVFLSNHSDKGAWGFLKSSAVKLKRMGITHCFYEIPSYLVLAFQRFNHDGDLNQLKTSIAKSQVRGVTDEALAFFDCLRKAGINILPVDMDIDAASATLDDRLTVGNAVTVRNAEYFIQHELPPSEKFMFVYGAMHYGIAQTLGLPSVVLSGEVDLSPENDPPLPTSERGTGSTTLAANRRMVADFYRTTGTMPLQAVAENTDYHLKVGKSATAAIMDEKAQAVLIERATGASASIAAIDAITSSLARLVRNPAVGAVRRSPDERAVDVAASVGVNLTNPWTMI